MSHPNTSDLQYIESSKKSKIMFFMSIDYTEIPEYGKLAIESIQKYCIRHGYVFKLNHYSKKDLDIPPYWLRVRDLQNYLHNTDYEYIIYFDLDVIINPYFFNSKITNLIDSIDYSTDYHWDMYLAKDPYIRNYEVNSGIIITKNTEWSKRFVSLWYDNFPIGPWKKIDDGSWECNSCTWAGDSYEQGMLNKLFTTNVLDSKKHIISVSNHLFGNKKLSYLDYTFIYHFMGYDNSKRLKMMKSLLILNY